MNSNVNKYSAAMEKMKGEPVPGSQGMTCGSILERPPMIRSQNADLTPELEAICDRIPSIISPPSSVATEEDMTSAKWWRAEALCAHGVAFREHEAAAAAILKTQQNVYRDGADHSLLTLAYERYTKATKELDAAEEKLKTFYAKEV